MLHPTDNHLYSPAGDSRERPVPCGTCGRATFNVCADCGRHCACPDADPDPRDAAAPMLAAVDESLHVFETTSLPALLEGATVEQGKDIKATLGMARLLRDVADAHPLSQTAWDMLASTLRALREKARILAGAAVLALITVGLVVAPTGTPGAAAAVSPNSTTTTVTTTVTKTVTTVTTTTPAPVVRRRSVVTGYVSAAGYSGRPGYGTINVMIQTRHVVGKGYAPSSYSPVLIQKLVAGQWKTVLTVTTGRDGLVFKQILAPSGVQRYRFLRPQGSTVTAAVSPVYVVAVPDRPGC